jgi:hypothetical protein
MPTIPTRLSGVLSSGSFTKLPDLDQTRRFMKAILRNQNGINDPKIYPYMEKNNANPSRRNARIFSCKWPRNYQVYEQVGNVMWPKTKLFLKIRTNTPGLEIVIQAPLSTMFN